MKSETRKTAGQALMLPVVGAGKPRRCPHCQSNKWIQAEVPRVVTETDSATGKVTRRNVPARYGCANCGCEFYVERSLQWKRVLDPEQCPHCASRSMLVAVAMSRGAVYFCQQCMNLGLYELPGHEGQVTVAHVKAAGKLTPEAHQFFGQQGFEFEVRRARRKGKNPG